ncbi:MAG TPA: pyruvate kinase [Clostridiales bacterium]|nr:pyruvate kinase [Clostridiales bacterium]
MRKTKIICTIGPACSDEATLEKMCLAGMNVARLNFSHETHEVHLKRIELIKKVREKLGLPIAILLDTKGPEFRTGTYENGKIELKKGDEFTLTVRDIVGNEKIVSVSYKNLNKELFAGDRVLINNGLVELEVKKVDGEDIICSVLTGGTLSNRKSMSFPGKTLKNVYLSEQDKADLLFGLEHGIDFVALSFVSSKKDVEDVSSFLAEHGYTSVDFIAKIENSAGVENIEEICSVCDGIMVARGDLGVEVPYESLPAIQKKLITKCRFLGKRVITATEMLETMIHNVRPTRAEISDVANAVYDGSSAIMLSGETAAGDYPVQSVEAMAKIAEYTENNIHYDKRFYSCNFEIKNLNDAISHATCGMALDIEAKAIVACTLSGRTARMISRFRCPVNIIGLTDNEETWRRLALSWGVTPKLCKKYEFTEELFEEAAKIAKTTLKLQKGDRIVITAGVAGMTGLTNTIKIETI